MAYAPARFVHIDATFLRIASIRASVIIRSGINVHNLFSRRQVLRRIYIKPIGEIGMGKHFHRTILSTATILAAGMIVYTTDAQDTKTDVPTIVLIKNVNVWDGTSDGLKLAHDVLVEGDKIRAVGPELEAVGATVIDGEGGTLIPGLMDSCCCNRQDSDPGSDSCASKWEIPAKSGGRSIDGIYFRILVLVSNFNLNSYHIHV